MVITGALLLKEHIIEKLLHKVEVIIEGILPHPLIVAIIEDHPLPKIIMKAMAIGGPLLMIGDLTTVVMKDNRQVAQIEVRSDMIDIQGMVDTIRDHNLLPLEEVLHLLLDTVVLHLLLLRLKGLLWSLVS